jgi:hypothetical protein
MARFARARARRCALTGGAGARRQGIPGITGIDTRALTKNLREHGCMLGKVVMEGTNPATVPLEDPNQVQPLAPSAPRAPPVPHRPSLR